MGTGFGKLMKQAKMIKEQVVKTEEVLANQVAEGSAGGGAVKAVVRGDERLVSVKIDPEVVRSVDIEMLEDLIVSAVNDGFRKIAALHKEAVDKIAQGLKAIGGPEALKRLGL